MGKPHRALFHEFKGGSANPDDVEGSGDVKYHLGASSDREFDGNKVHLSLTANPSHLEIVDPVVLGKVRAKQDQHGDPPDQRISVLPLLMHGDAAFAGQGVVAECFGLSGLKGYRTGGSMHFIVNNQIGFTTYPRYSRSSPYPSDVAKMIEAPIFHVNGDDPEAVVFAAKVAIEFRQKFHKPVVIDMFCYRRFGHNEGDEPAFTQPLMYKKIRVASRRRSRSTPSGWSPKASMTEGEVDKAKADWRARLDAEFEAGAGYKPNKADWLDGQWAGFKRPTPEEDPRRGDTGVDVDELKEIGRKITTVPDGFQRPQDHRSASWTTARKAIETGEGIDWATGEALAFGTLLRRRPSRPPVGPGHRARHLLPAPFGADRSGRRRAATSRSTISATARAHYEVINSLLSEEAVLGFEYGYSLAEPKALMLWEAQFGDFANGAQVVIDQFISSGERKWLRMSGLVCCCRTAMKARGRSIPRRGSSAILQLCAEDNMQVVDCHHAGQLLPHAAPPDAPRVPQAADRDDAEVAAAPQARGLAPDGHAARTPPSTACCATMPRCCRARQIKLVPDDKIRRVVLCSGKVYYDLMEEREKRGDRRRLAAAPRAALSVPAEGAGPGAEPLQERRGGLVPGRAAEHGRLELRRALSRMGAEPDQRAEQAPALRRPRRRRPRPPTGLMSKHLAQLKAFLDEALS